MTNELKIAEIRGKLSTIARDLQFIACEFEDAGSDELYELTEAAEDQCDLASYNLTKVLNRLAEKAYGD